MKNKPLYIIVGGPDNEVWTNPDIYSGDLPYEQALELMQKLQAQALADGTGLAFEMLED